MVALILKLLEDNERKQLFIKRSKDKIVKKMSIERMINDFEKYYLSILNWRQING